MVQLTVWRRKVYLKTYYYDNSERTLQEKGAFPKIEKTVICLQGDALSF